MFKQISLLILLALISTNSIAAKKTQIPVSAFNQMPMVQQPIISPDGENIAVITNQGDQTQVSIVPFNDPGAMKTIVALGEDKYRIESIYWANNQRVLVSVTQPFRASARQLRTSHLYSASIAGGDVVELKKRLSKKATQWEFYRSTPHLLSLLKKEPNHILVTVNDIRDNYYSSVFKVDIRNGDFEKYISNGKKIVGWHVNSVGDILMAVGRGTGDNSDTRYIYTRKNNDADWQLIKERKSFEGETFEPVLYEPETNSVIVISDYKLSKDALWRYDITSGEYNLLGKAPGNFDIDRAITQLDGDLRKVVGFSYTEHFVKRVYFDKNNQTLNQQISNLFQKSGLQAFVSNWDKNKQRYMIYAVSDTRPGQYYLFDRKNPKIVPWYGMYPSLLNEKLAAVTPFKFKARDGMNLNGYITLPIGIKNPPLIVHPHGGPYGVRDKQYFDPFVQLFASRGYAVLQVNYRGSGGFGNRYLTSGYEKWGKEMQTDLIDAVNWVKKEKLADTHNSCIAGASYGGYAALAAGYQTPKQFKCIVSIAGVGDMDSQIIHWRRKNGKSYVNNIVNVEGKSLKHISPLFHTNKFEAPVLLIHGKVDQQVSYRQSEAMYEALKEADKEVELELFKFGTHHLNDAVNRKKAMGLMIEFIDEHLKS